MALRILSGFVNIGNGPKNGQVRIRFNPHQRIDGDAPVIERRTIGASGDFVSEPAKLIALRQISLHVPVEPTTVFTTKTMKLRLGDTITANRLTITWNGVGQSFTEEISYMVIGEVADPPVPIPFPPFRPGGRRKRSKARRSSSKKR